MNFGGEYMYLTFHDVHTKSWRDAGNTVMRDFKLRQCIRETPDWQTKQKLSNPCEFSRKTITFEMYMCNDSGRHACKVTDRHVAALLWRSHFVEFQMVIHFVTVCPVLRFRLRTVRHFN